MLKRLLLVDGELLHLVCLGMIISLGEGSPTLKTENFEPENKIQPIKKIYFLKGTDAGEAAFVRVPGLEGGRRGGGTVGGAGGSAVLLLVHQGRDVGDVRGQRRTHRRRRLLLLNDQRLFGQVVVQPPSAGHPQQLAAKKYSKISNKFEIFS